MNDPQVQQLGGNLYIAKLFHYIATLTQPARLTGKEGVMDLEVGENISFFEKASTAKMREYLGREVFVMAGPKVKIGEGKTRRDFQEFKPPLVFLVHAVAQWVCGVARFRDFFLAAPLASILSVEIALLGRRVDEVLAAAFGLTMAALFTCPTFHDTALSDSEAIGLAFFLFGLAAALAGGPKTIQLGGTTTA
jgi:hypothetical protein